MQTDAKDYLFSGSLIALVLAATALVLSVVDGLLLPLSVPSPVSSCSRCQHLPTEVLRRLCWDFFLYDSLCVRDSIAWTIPSSRFWKVQHVVGERRQGRPVAVFSGFCASRFLRAVWRQCWQAGGCRRQNSRSAPDHPR